jgi:hypothetical protein
MRPQLAIVVNDIVVAAAPPTRNDPAPVEATPEAIPVAIKGKGMPSSYSSLTTGVLRISPVVGM